MTVENRRIVFIIPDQITSWQCSVITRCLADTKLEVVTVMEVDAREKDGGIPLLARMHLAADKVLYSQFQSAVRSACKQDLALALEQREVGVKKIYSEDDARLALRAVNEKETISFVDFTHFGFVDSLLEEFSECVFLRLHFGLSDPKSVDLVGYEEVLNHDTEIHISITQTTAASSCLIKETGCYKLFPASLSKTRNYLLWRGASLLFDTLKRGTASSCCSQVHVSANRYSVLSYPKYILGMLALAWKKKTKKSHWTLAVSKSDMLPDSIRSFTEIQQPADRFWADPFVVRDGDQVHVFLEELEYAKGRGDIALLTIDKYGVAGPCVKLIEKDYHLSYPFVFEVDGTYFMIPETSENRTVDLYRCHEFPGKWEFEKTLMDDVVAADTTLFFHDGKWWMFTTIDDGVHGSNDDELYLFYADSHDSTNWTAHPMNPVVRDVRSARLAGRVFVDPRGRIIRPSQDCSAFYGRGLNINEVECLTTLEYREKRINRLDAEGVSQADGVHTFNCDQGVSIIDQFCWVR